MRFVSVCVCGAFIDFSVFSQPTSVRRTTLEGVGRKRSLLTCLSPDETFMNREQIGLVPQSFPLPCMSFEVVCVCAVPPPPPRRE